MIRLQRIHEERIWSVDIVENTFQVYQGSKDSGIYVFTPFDINNNQYEENFYYYGVTGDVALALKMFRGFVRDWPEHFI